MQFVHEFIRFLVARRRLWMFPIFALLGTLGGLLMLTHGTVVAPFIYTLF